SLVDPAADRGHLADLLDQPLEPLHPLPDVIDRARVRPLVGKLVLYRAGEQLAHAVGGGWLVSAKQDVVSRPIRDAPSEGVAQPGGSAVPVGSSVPLAPGTGQL